MEIPSSPTTETQWFMWDTSHAVEPLFVPELPFDLSTICDQGICTTLPPYFDLDAEGAALPTPDPEQSIDPLSGTTTTTPFSSSDLGWNSNPESTAAASAAESQSLSMAHPNYYDKFEETPATTGSPLTGVHSQHPPALWSHEPLCDWEVVGDSFHDSLEEPLSREKDMDPDNMANDLSAKPADVFNCGSCPATFTKRHKLSRHERVHTKPYRCRVCGMGHAEKRDYRRHLWANHREVAKAEGIPSERLKCRFSDCGFTSRKDNVKRHEKTHGPVGRKGRPILPRLNSRLDASSAALPGRQD